MKKFLFATALSIAAASAAVMTFAPPAHAQDDAYDSDDDTPPVEVMATLTPVYFQGHPAYWWHNRWHWRDTHGAWFRYRGEPGYLHTWRGVHPIVERHYYTTGRPAPHPVRGGGRR